MHSTRKGPSLSGSCSGLPRMWWPLEGLRLRRLQFVLGPVVLVPVLPHVGEQWGQPEQRRRLRQQLKAALVASQFIRGVHACRSAGTNASPRQCRKANAPA